MNNRKHLILLITISLMIAGCSRHNDSPKRVLLGSFYLPAEGGPIKVEIDSVTKLDDLVKELRTNNDLVMTGKAYLIGYNNLMFSIAAYSDYAIKPLLNLIDTTQDFTTKRAAIYTLHLIGINCKIEWFQEDFQNVKARNALLNLMKTDSLQDPVLELLVRNPWHSDVPRIFEILKNSQQDNWLLCNGLSAFNIPDAPFDQSKPLEIDDLTVKVVRTQKPCSVKEYNRLILITFRDQYKNRITIDDSLLNYDFYIPLANCWYDTILIDNETGEESWTFLEDDCYKKDRKIFMEYIIGTAHYLRNGISWRNNFAYTLKDGKLLLCTPKTCKKMWLEWWDSRSKSYQDSLKTSKVRNNSPM